MECAYIHRSMEKSILNWAYDYLKSGDIFLRHHRGHAVIEALLDGERAGIDVRGLLRDALRDLSACDQLFSQYQSVQKGLALRAIVIGLMVYSVRLILLSSIPDPSWNEWIAVDRVAWTAMVVVLLSLFTGLYRHDQTKGTTYRSQKFLRSWFCSYVVLNSDGAGDLALQVKLRAAKVAEIRSGSDSHLMRQQLYLDSLGEHLISLRRDLERLPLTATVMEMFLFALCSAGWLGIPFIAWLETRSGGL